MVIDSRVFWKKWSSKRQGGVVNNGAKQGTKQSLIQATKTTSDSPDTPSPRLRRNDDAMVML